MPPLAPILLLIVAACPISASIVIVAILPARAEIFSGAASGVFLTQLYFVAPALFAALGSLALRRVAARGAPERFLVVGALGFAAFGLADGLNTDHAGVAFAMRAGVGVSIACLMTGFNRIAMQRWDRATSTWLLTYLNLATSAYGLAAALLAAQLALWSEYAPFLLFGLPALGLAAYLATAPGARAVPAPQSGGVTNGGVEAVASSLPPGHMALIVVGHMAIHVLFYLHLARTEFSLGGHALGNGERTALYVFGHLLGAILFRPVSRLFANFPAHLAAALGACLFCTGGLAAINGGGAGAVLLLPLGGAGAEPCAAAGLRLHPRFGAAAGSRPEDRRRRRRRLPRPVCRALHPRGVAGVFRHSSVAGLRGLDHLRPADALGCRAARRRPQAPQSDLRM